MDDEVRLSAEAEAVASQIRSVDRELDQMDTDRDGSVVLGMRVGFAAAIVKLGQDSADQRRERLLAERAALVVQLKSLIPGS